MSPEVLQIDCLTQQMFSCADGWGIRSFANVSQSPSAEGLGGSDTVDGSEILPTSWCGSYHFNYMVLYIPVG